MPGQITDNPGDPLLQQVAQFKPFDRQAVHRPARLKRKTQQARSLGRFLAQLIAQQIGQSEPARGRIGSGRHIRTGTQRIK